MTSLAQINICNYLSIRKVTELQKHFRDFIYFRIYTEQSLLSL